MTPHIVTEEHAARVWEWLQTRGGLACWNSVNLSNPGASWTTPRLREDGTPVTKPSWQAEGIPSRIITDPADVVVSVDREVKRFRVATRIGAQGFMVKLTDASSRRVRTAVDKAGEGAYHRFDYATQEAVIMAPERQVPLLEWVGDRTPVLVTGERSM